MKINRRKLPIKYALEVYTQLPGYPSQNDLEFVLLQTLQDKSLLEKNFTAENVWSGMKNHIGTIDELRKLLDTIFLSDNLDGTSAITGTKTSANSYLLTTHDWA